MLTNISFVAGVEPEQNAPATGHEPLFQRNFYLRTPACTLGSGFEPKNVSHMLMGLCSTGGCLGACLRGWDLEEGRLLVTPKRLFSFSRRMRAFLTAITAAALHENVSDTSLFVALKSAKRNRVTGHRM